MDVVYATTTTMVPVNGAQHRIQKGSHWPADDPIVLAQPSLFSTDARYGLMYTSEPAGYNDEPPVEQATAAPGEQRATRRPGR